MNNMKFICDSLFGKEFQFVVAANIRTATMCFIDKAHRAWNNDMLIILIIFYLIIIYY